MNCLSWDFPKNAPPSYHEHRSPLPVTPCGTTFGMRLPRHTHVPSSWFLTTATVYSSAALRVYCNALPTVGFTPFPLRLQKLPSVRFASPECCPYPPKPSLRSQLPESPASPRFHGASSLSDGWASPACRHAVHRHPCPLTLSFPSPLPSLRSPVRASVVQFRRASRPSSMNGSVASPAVSRRTHPVLPWVCSGTPFPRAASDAKNRNPRERQRPLLPTPPRCFHLDVPGRERGSRSGPPGFPGVGQT